MWNTLKSKAEAVSGRAILDLFDDARADGFTVQTQHMRFDYSKTNIDAETRDMLLELASAAGGRRTARRDVRGRENQ